MNHSIPSGSTLRIALLTYSTKPRGSVVHTLELAIALHQLGHTVCVCALDKDGTGFDRILPCEVKLIPAQPAPQDMDQLIHQRIQEFVAGLSDRWQQGDLNYDIFHAQDCLSANALTELRQRYGQAGFLQEGQHSVVPHLIRTVHHIENYSSPYLRNCQDRSIREADLCVCVSQHWQQQLKTHYNLEAPRVINGINTQRFTSQRFISQRFTTQRFKLESASSGQQDAELKQRLGIQLEPSALTYLTVGGIEPRKNSIRLLQAFAQVLKVYPQSQLVIAGGATLFDYQPYRDNFFAEVERLGIAVGVSLILPGVLSDQDLTTLYRAADIFVFPSVKEGWGMVVLEAIASGLPVIVPNQAPFTEFLAPEQAQWIDPEEVNTITQAMLAFRDLGQRQTFIHASQSVLPKYTWERSAHLHITHYQALIRTKQMTNK